MKGLFLKSKLLTFQHTRFIEYICILHSTIEYIISSVLSLMEGNRLALINDATFHLIVF